MSLTVNLQGVARVFYGAVEAASIWVNGLLLWARPPAPGETYGVRTPDGEVILVQLADTWTPVLSHNNDGNVVVGEEV